MFKYVEQFLKMEPNRVILGIYGGFQGVGVKRPIFIDVFNSLVSDCWQSLLPVAWKKRMFFWIFEWMWLSRNQKPLY